MRQNSVGQQIDNLSRHSSLQSLSNFCTVNELEKSMSYIEKTAKKLLPIILEVKKKMIPDKKKTKSKGDGKLNKSNFRTQLEEGSDEEDDDDLVIDLSKVKGKKKPNQFDMKNILGYLN